MDAAEVMNLAHTLKGAPISCFFVMVVLRRAVGPSRLSLLTGYNRHATADALEKLAMLNLAARTGYHNSWCLTDKGYQLPLVNLSLPDSSPLSPDITTGRISTSGSRSSCFKLIESDSDSSLKQQQQLALVENLPVTETNPEKSRLTSLLAATGCPRRNAAKAVAESLTAGDSPTAIEIDILRWSAYCQSEHGQGIKFRGVFIATKIQNGEQIPDWFSLPYEVELKIQNILNRESDL